MQTVDRDASALRFAICPMADRSGLRLPQFFGSRHEAADWVRSIGGTDWIEEPLEVVSLQSCIGPVFQGKRLLEWLPREKIPAPQVLMTTEAVTERMIEVGLQELAGETAWPACCLDVDWRFAEIEREARTLPGHNYLWKTHSSLRDVVWNALADFDAVIATWHPNATVSALAHFWRSWQIYQHVMRFCREKVANSVENWSEAGQFALRQLNSYASAISMALVATGGDGELNTALRADRWEEIELSIDDHSIEIRVNDKSETCGYVAFGCQDKRNSNPNEQWAMLQVLGRGAGLLPDDARHSDEWLAIAKRVERTRKILQKRFGMNDDPIPYERGKGYRARFKIRRVQTPPSPPDDDK